MKNFTPPNVAKQVAQHFIKFRKTPPPFRNLGEHKLLQVGGDYSSKKFIVKPRQKPPKMLSEHFGVHLPRQLVFNAAVV